MGSSRTRWALRAEHLNAADDQAAPVVLNWGANGGGSMLAQTFLRRALEAGIRPEAIFLEVLPLSLSARHGLPVEESLLCPWRLTASETSRLRPYCAQPYRVDLRWAAARLLPVRRHHAELRDALALDVPAEGRRLITGRDRYGWIPGQQLDSPEEVQKLTKQSLGVFQSALTQPELAPGALEAVRDMVRLCRAEQIDVVLVIPPEGTVFRRQAPAVADFQVKAVYDLARQLGTPLVDASDWVDDDGFIDGHHANVKGAEHYTRRFAEEVLGRYLEERHQRAQAISHDGARPSRTAVPGEQWGALAWPRAERDAARTRVAAGEPGGGLPAF
jgi:hypothetical protein